jgi:hypothetical protein
MRELLVRARYECANVWRSASSAWQQTDVAPESCSSLFAASFGSSGWHHIRCTLEEFDRSPEVGYRDTTLYRYLMRFCPTSISDFARPGDGQKLPLFVYPWGTFRVGEETTTKDPWRSRFCGPSTDDFVREEFDRTIALYRRMREEGYQPRRFPHSFIGGTWLERGDGRRRFVVLQGNHRMAILAHLGYSAIAVRPLRGWLARVREEDVKSWPSVRSGACSVDHALGIFSLFFDQTGYHLKAAVDAPGHTLSRM